VAYVNEYRTHELRVKFTLYKRFLKSATFDFDALTFPVYRTRGLPFVVFELVKAELADKTAGVSAPCRLQG
jgi:hypothetical protein